MEYEDRAYYKRKEKGKKKREYQMERGWDRGRKDWAEMSIMPYANELRTLSHLNGYTGSYSSNGLVISVKYGLAQPCKLQHNMCKNTETKKTPLMSRPMFSGCIFSSF